jgi:hypothetical protein
MPIRERHRLASKAGGKAAACYAPLVPSAPLPLRINRAPVLTMWAAVVAERLGYPPETALTLGRFVAGSSARAKARRLGIVEETEEAAERRERVRELRGERPTVRLLGREIPVLPAPGGTLRAEDDGKHSSAESVAAYVARAFGDRLAEARAAMEALAESLPPDELNRVGFRLYERFRPDVPEGVKGWGREGRARFGSDHERGRHRLTRAPRHVTRLTAAGSGPASRNFPLLPPLKALPG